MDSINNTSKLGGDAWLELQAFKTRQINRRERLNRHKDLVNGITVDSQHTTISNSTSTTQVNTPINTADHNHEKEECCDRFEAHQALISNAPDWSKSTGLQTTNVTTSESQSTVRQISNTTNRELIIFGNDKRSPSKHAQGGVHLMNSNDVKTVECLLLLKLCDVAMKLPVDSKSLQRSICKVKGLEHTQKSTIENLLEKFAHQELITIEELSNVILDRRSHNVILNSTDREEESCIYVVSADHTKLVEFDRTFGSSDKIRSLLLETRTEDPEIGELGSIHHIAKQPVPIQSIKSHANISLSSLAYDEAEDSNHNKSRTFKSSPKDSYKSISEHAPIRRSMNDDVETLLSLSSTRERESKKLGEELLELLSKPTAKERNLLERFRSADGYQVQEFCPKGTKDECRRNNRGTEACDRLHFKKIIAKHTEESLGDCSFLNTCFHMDSCKYVHYEVDSDAKQHSNTKRTKLAHQKGKPSKKSSNLATDRQSSTSGANDAATKLSPEIKLATAFVGEKNQSKATKTSDNFLLIQSMTDIATNYTLSPAEQARIDIRNRKRFKAILYPPQWIQCDLRYFDMSLLGKFSVVMADPPWDIHMELPYGTMSDDEMRKLNIPALQDEGVIFLWVTGRAMELGRECLALWGYERCDEIIWVKTNQLQRIIRTGRTGHWLNHGKEHCLVGVKGNPTEVNRGLDCDIIVAEVRATSHKPDEIYGIIERLSPGTRKIELFGRAHNVQPNWITLGNQLNGVRLVEPNLMEAFEKNNLPYQTSDQI